jgi:1-acyl-sn-glycerol-3-phosphate acyltransferase
MSFYNKLIIIWRSLQLFFHFLAGIILSFIFLRNRLPPRSFAARLNIWWHKRLCTILAVKHECIGEISNTPTLFVANHISWFDIPAVSAVLPLHFLAKQEINSWPVIGWLANKAGTLFIPRGQKGAAQVSIQAITEDLRSGCHVLIFPEGTTCDGTRVGHFHSRLLQSAFDAGVVVQPIAITYPHPDGVHPRAPYVGDTQLLDSALGFLTPHDIHVCLHFLPVLNTKDFAGRDEITGAAKKMIAAKVGNQPVAANDDL